MTDPLTAGAAYRIQSNIRSTASPAVFSDQGILNHGFAPNRSFEDFNNTRNSLNSSNNRIDCSGMTEDEYREYLDRTFKPMFVAYERTGGIPCQHLLRMFQFKDYGLPKMRREQLLLRMDADRNGKITYHVSLHLHFYHWSRKKEFKKCLINIRFRDLSTVKRFGLCSALAANPGIRLREAKAKVRRKLAEQLMEKPEIGEAQVDSAYPGISADPITGGYKHPGGKFYLEPDGVWPTSRKAYGLAPGDVWDNNGPKVPISEEAYVPNSYLDAYNCKPPPIFIPAIVIVQIAVFIYYAVLINSQPDAVYNRVTWFSGLPIMSPLYYDPRRRREAWRYISYMFIHSGYEHIILNSLASIILGMLVEWVNKLWRVAPVYLAGVFLGCLGHSVLDPNIILVGASGGVYAMIGAHLALVVINWEEMQHDWTNIRQNPIACMTSGVVRLTIILAFLFFDFAFALYRRFGVDEIQRISFIAHVFGFVAGLLIGIPVLRNINEKPWERVLFWVCLVLFFILVIIGILFNIFWPGYVAQQV
ncbi:hypothetical protein Ciccas_000729 [Cichlidogyrus casuarinus]|uniref:Peptidase S54 rhomboid domain-containing protein n=1 Tax=Cichlidogyrus casuarinus TaxID=1844966 RepID=A0ABD2QM42_9PLAT